MPKKKAPKRKGKTKEKDVIDQRMEHFGEEIERLGKRMEKRGKEWESWFHRTFGLVGPLISSIFGIIIFALLSWVLYLINIPVGSIFLGNVYYFLTDNMGLFFLIFLFFSYSSYFSKAFPRMYRPVSPVLTAVGITIGLWIAIQAINIANISLGITQLSILMFYIEVNLLLIFWVALFLGYLVLAVKTSTCETVKYEKEAGMKKAEKTETGEIRRLYRSGKDRILGGVCGGIAEYLGVDPVIIRLLWIVLTIAAMGTGIIPYIIFWIVIPRNPKHKWED